MFLLDYLFILLLGVNTGIITAYLMEGLYGNTMMTIDFSNVPAYMVAVIAGGFLAAIGKYLFDEIKESKKIGKLALEKENQKLNTENQKYSEELQKIRNNRVQDEPEP